ncbi:hypothetical protein SAY87_002488 [Trapa incisa]|uniref:Uncharacterized protein n=1 Tax=Trapa incisa TaxID=236973 RepID=A0AAN7PV67_9MYRT|nr:hypothetical protein SAY87_002488 [Trapa incisa]
MKRRIRIQTEIWSRGLNLDITQPEIRSSQLSSLGVTCGLGPSVLEMRAENYRVRPNRQQSRLRRVNCVSPEMAPEKKLQTSCFPTCVGAAKLANLAWDIDPIDPPVHADRIRVPFYKTSSRHSASTGPQNPHGRPTTLTMLMLTKIEVYEKKERETQLNFFTLLPPKSAVIYTPYAGQI